MIYSKQEKSVFEFFGIFFKLFPHHREIFDRLHRRQQKQYRDHTQNRFAQQILPDKVHNFCRQQIIPCGLDPQQHSTDPVQQCTQIQQHYLQFKVFSGNPYRSSQNQRQQYQQYAMVHIQLLKVNHECIFFLEIHA